MWLSQKRPERWESPAQVGVVTLEGDPAAVYQSGERRDLPVFAPGGYCWCPPWARRFWSSKPERRERGPV